MTSDKRVSTSVQGAQRTSNKKSGRDYTAQRTIREYNSDNVLVAPSKSTPIHYSSLVGNFADFCSSCSLKPTCSSCCNKLLLLVGSRFFFPSIFQRAIFTQCFDHCAPAWPCTGIASWTQVYRHCVVRPWPSVSVSDRRPLARPG